MPSDLKAAKWSHEKKAKNPQRRAALAMHMEIGDNRLNSGDMNFIRSMEVSNNDSPIEPSSMVEHFQKYKKREIALDILTKTLKGWIHRSHHPPGNAIIGLAIDGKGNSASKRNSLVLDEVRKSDPLVFSAIDYKRYLEKSNTLRLLLKTWKFMFWASNFRRLDPRFQILTFFNAVEIAGVESISGRDLNPNLNPLVRRLFVKSSVFTVWRPTSNDAIRKMMTGEGTGKGLNIKGKSAKTGKLSGYVPFIQIHEEDHKKKIRPLTIDGRMRIYYSSSKARNKAARILEVLSLKMAAEVARAKNLLSDTLSLEVEKKKARETLMFDMEDPKLEIIDDYMDKDCFGIDIAQRLFWKGYVTLQDISRLPESDFYTGRPSIPQFQDMNFEAIGLNQKGSDSPRPVVWQFAKNEGDAMCPKRLLMAYEQNGRVIPVVSDFDCFILGTRGIKYENPLPIDQLKVMKWCITQTKEILENPQIDKSWTQCWLEMLKKSSATEAHPKMPEFGLSDSTTYSIMKCAINRLNQSGAVRHGAECFNYTFPQDIDDEYLVISDTLDGKVPWKKVNVQELQDILCEHIENGFTFPINPKWVLCDPGWKKVYDKLLATKNPTVQKSIDCWFPPDSDVREAIEEIHSQHPKGFWRNNASISTVNGHEHEVILAEYHPG